MSAFRDFARTSSRDAAYEWSANGDTLRYRGLKLRAAWFDLLAEMRADVIPEWILGKLTRLLERK